MLKFKQNHKTNNFHIFNHHHRNIKKSAKNLNFKNESKNHYQLLQNLQKCHLKYKTNDQFVTKPKTFSKALNTKYTDSQLFTNKLLNQRKNNIKYRPLYQKVVKSQSQIAKKSQICKQNIKSITEISQSPAPNTFRQIKIYLKTVRSQKTFTNEENHSNNSVCSRQNNEIVNMNENAKGKLTTIKSNAKIKRFAECQHYKQNRSDTETNGMKFENYKKNANNIINKYYNEGKIEVNNQIQYKKGQFKRVFRQLFPLDDTPSYDDTSFL